MMPETENAAPLKTPSFVLPIPASPAIISIDLPDPTPLFSAANSKEKLSHPQQVSCHKEQLRPQYEVADIFNLYGEKYRQTHKLTTDQLNVMYAICHCRTDACGFHADICDNCGYIETAYNSCRNRHCPKCQGVAKRKWVNARLNELLPVAYHHATFTLPNQLSKLSLYNQKLIYDLLFNAASQTLLSFGDDPKWLGAKIGFYGVLHTWSQALWPHVHIHFIVTAGGLTDNGEWVEPKYKGKFLFPVPALSKVFRGKFIEGLKKAYYAGNLVIPESREDLNRPERFEQWLDRLVSRNWVVNSKPPFAGPEEVVRYIGRYTHRVAISNSRILSVENGQVRFSYKDNKEKDKSKMWKEMVLPADQFIERFLWHILPPHYHRIRHYGFLTNGKKKANLEIIRQSFSSQEDVETSTQTTTENSDGITCPKCKKGKLRPFLVTDRYNQILKFDVSVFIKHEECNNTS